MSVIDWLPSVPLALLLAGRRRRWWRRSGAGLARAEAQHREWIAGLVRRYGYRWKEDPR